MSMYRIVNVHPHCSYPGFAWIQGQSTWHSRSEAEDALEKAAAASLLYSGIWAVAVAP